MKLTIHESDDHESMEIVVKCKTLNDEVIKVLTSLRSLERKVLSTKEGEIEDAALSKAESSSLMFSGMHNKSLSQKDFDSSLFL